VDYLNNRNSPKPPKTRAFYTPKKPKFTENTRFCLFFKQKKHLKSNRNSPFSPFSVNSVTEIRRPPYIEGGKFGGFFRRLEKVEAGLFFHWFEAGEIEEQGHLLELNADGIGLAQMFEWFTGAPERVKPVTPAYLAGCVFYTSAAAMREAYDHWEANQ